MRSPINYRATSSTQPARWTPFSGWRMAHPLLVFLALLAWSICIRGPFFGRDYIDKDESTFVHMGTSWAEGHLPYTELWDLKPPMTFAYFAAVVGLFGQHLWLIRLIGAALVAAVGYSTYRLIRLHAKETTAQALGALTVALLSLFGSVQGVMSEHIALFFWTPGVWALIHSTLRSTQHKTALIWCAGILLSLSVATKLNMAYAVLGLVVPWMISFRNTRQIIQLALGGTVPVAVFAWLYRDHLELLWSSAVLASWAYTQLQKMQTPGLIAIVLWLLIPLVIWGLKPAHKAAKPSFWMIWGALAGVSYSIWSVGKLNGHYLLLVYPIWLCAMAWSFSGWSLKPMGNRARLITAWGMLLLPVESYLEAYRWGETLVQTGYATQGEGFEVARALQNQGVAPQRVLWLEYHIGSWVMGGKPLSAASTHPSNIAREGLFPYFNSRKTSTAELSYLLDTLSPKYIVVGPKPIFGQDHPQLQSQLDQTLEECYFVSETVGAAVIWAQRSPQS